MSEEPREIMPPIVDEASGPSVWPNAIAYMLGLGCAWYFNWETADLIWSLWFCSLLIGYATILSAIGGGLRKVSAAGVPKPLGIIGAVFTFCFFSVHFCGFHAGHATFLSSFFPLGGVATEQVAKLFINPPGLLLFAVKQLGPIYGIFLLPALLVERRGLIEAWKGAPTHTGANAKATSGIGGAMGKPYKNVLTMHLLIFFFGIASTAGLSGFVLYATAYSVYFFPWGILKRRKKTERS